MGVGIEGGDEEEDGRKGGKMEGGCAEMGDGERWKVEPYKGLLVQDFKGTSPAETLGDCAEGLVRAPNLFLGWIQVSLGPHVVSLLFHPSPQEVVVSLGLSCAERAHLVGVVSWGPGCKEAGSACRPHLLLQQWKWIWDRVNRLYQPFRALLLALLMLLSFLAAL